jgi:hypothetical protein
MHPVLFVPCRLLESRSYSRLSVFLFAGILGANGMPPGTARPGVFRYEITLLHDQISINKTMQRTAIKKTTAIKRMSILPPV